MPRVPQHILNRVKNRAQVSCPLALACGSALWRGSLDPLLPPGLLKSQHLFLLSFQVLRPVCYRPRIDSVSAIVQVSVCGGDKKGRRRGCVDLTQNFGLPTFLLHLCTFYPAPSLSRKAVGIHSARRTCLLRLLLPTARFGHLNVVFRVAMQ